MATVKMRVEHCPTSNLPMTNRVIINPEDHRALLGGTPHVVVVADSSAAYVVTLHPDAGVPQGGLGFSLLQRKWATLSVRQEVEVSPYRFSEIEDLIGTMKLAVDFYSKKSSSQEAYNTDAMAKEFLMQFPKQAFSVGQRLVFQFMERPLLALTVESISTTDLNMVRQGKPAKLKPATTGLSFPNTVLVFERAEGSSVLLSGKSKGKAAAQTIINPDWDFTKMGIGGLDKEFNDIFRRAFASRVFPPEIMQQLGGQHVKGILLFGPPGTGKTLMARQIGQMLNAREPKIVKGPEILDKYVGESEANIRKLFAEAEEEEKKMGPNSGLHIIIFDEIDAICKTRGSVAGNTGVNDTVVNQLLSKIDGVDQLNNILVIGMTNRRDMIDEALLRPGRLEVSIEIGLPNEKGRVQILNIHTRKMKTNGKLDKDVDINALAKTTKNFSGAELEGLVRAAQSCALNRLVKASSKVEVDPDAAEKLMVTKADFEHALEHDIKPAFGTSEESLDEIMGRGLINWGTPVQEVLEDGKLLIQHASSPEGPGLVSVMLEGSPNTGKTALAAQLAKMSNFPFVKICSPEDMVGFTETGKCMRIKKIFEDAYRSPLSCIIVDNMERLMDYGPIGPRYSNLTLQALLVLMKKLPPPGKRLLILCTSSRREVLEMMEMLPVFTEVLHVPNLREAAHIKTVLIAANMFSGAEVEAVTKKLASYRISIGVKKLLDLLDMVKQMPIAQRITKLLNKLEAERYIVPIM